MNTHTLYDFLPFTFVFGGFILLAVIFLTARR